MATGTPQSRKGDMDAARARMTALHSTETRRPTLRGNFSSASKVGSPYQPEITRQSVLRGAQAEIARRGNARLSSGAAPAVGMAGPVGPTAPVMTPSSQGPMGGQTGPMGPITPAPMGPTGAAPFAGGGGAKGNMDLPFNPQAFGESLADTSRSVLKNTLGAPMGLAAGLGAKMVGGDFTDAYGAGANLGGKYLADGIVGGVKWTGKGIGAAGKGLLGFGDMIGRHGDIEGVGRPVGDFFGGIGDKIRSLGQSPDTASHSTEAFNRQVRVKLETAGINKAALADGLDANELARLKRTLPLEARNFADKNPEAFRIAVMKGALNY